MLEICGFTLRGYEGCLVTVETDLRRGLPGTEIIGLPDSAVKEAKERVRAAIKNSQFVFPTERLLINMTPAGVKKEGTSFDLAIALAVLDVSGQIQVPEERPSIKVMILRELELSGRVRAVPGVLSALAGGLDAGVSAFIIPKENESEAHAVAEGLFWPVSTLKEAIASLQQCLAGIQPSQNNIKISTRNTLTHFDVDMKDIKGQPFMKRAMEVAAAGRHHLFFFGPPGCGKTLCCRAMPSILSQLHREQSLEVSRIYSIKGLLNNDLILQAPFRQPHHSASPEGIIGGGKTVLPGEISLAHHGILFLDEAPEFGKEVLQNLREPLENQRIPLARAGQTVWFPADFQLIMTANVCPCGSMGRNDKVCLCSQQEINRYWKRIGGAVLDRIDIRLPAKPLNPEILLSVEEESSTDVRERIVDTIERQKQRFKDLPFKYNSRIPASHIKEFCILSEEAEKAFVLAVNRLSLSMRAGHSILRLARTIADLDHSKIIQAHHTLEAASYRRYGDNDLFWTEI